MSTVFIVRPFGTRPVLKKDPATQTTSVIQYNFNIIETELIKPAMVKLELTGGTTGEVFAAGDIREDMFSQLLLADVVIADITIYNANVFYELGIRHALRDKRTILIKCPGFDETPFDIIGYRYLSYDKDHPKESLPDLISMLKETLEGERKDSPVFNVLPFLKMQDPEKYLAVPEDFINEVKLAEQTRMPGKLALLAFESESFGWKFPALRLIGNALFRLGERNTARQVWTQIIEKNRNDVEANEKLSTIYQRLAELEMKLNPEEGVALLAQSDLATDIVIRSDEITGYQKAEAYALKARNAKTRWINSWKETPLEVRLKKAQQSLHLDTAFKYYEKGFYEDLNHYYSGINALGLLSVIISLAEKDPVTWELAYESADDAEQKLKELRRKWQRISAALQMSLESARIKLEAQGLQDDWLSITDADFLCLTSPSPARVAASYSKALQNAGGLNMDATVRQLKMYEALGVKTDNIQAVLGILPAENEQAPLPTHYILFTGHMIDKPDRANPRFPASKELVAREAIKQAVIAEINKLPVGTKIAGVTGGACGGDILFLEVCGELGIAAQMLLAMPREKFLKASVSFAGSQWIERFDKLVAKLPHPVLSDDEELPKWLQSKPGYNIWMRNNLWMLNRALVSGGMHMTHIALWDGKGGDGPGGTADMVKQASDRGAKVVMLDITKM